MKFATRALALSLCLAFYVQAHANPAVTDAEEGALLFVPDERDSDQELSQDLAFEPIALGGSNCRVQRGRASWYGGRFHGRRTASGERYNQNGSTAAHNRLRFGTHVRVTSLGTGRSVNVKVNDRGRFGPGVVIDLSRGAASQIGLLNAGVGPVAISICN